MVRHVACCGQHCHDLRDGGGGGEREEAVAATPGGLLHTTGFHPTLHAPGQDRPKHPHPCLHQHVHHSPQDIHLHPAQVCLLADYPTQKVFYPLKNLKPKDDPYLTTRIFGRLYSNTTDTCIQGLKVSRNLSHLKKRKGYGTLMEHTEDALLN